MRQAERGTEQTNETFTFQENFYDALNLLDDKQSGQYVKAICGYVFEDKTPTLKPPLNGFFTLAKRKLNLSKVRRRVGSKGGNAERIPVKSEQVNEANGAPRGHLDMDGFLGRHPDVRNDIYKSSMYLTTDVDWNKLDYLLVHSTYKDCKSLYQILTHYKESVG